MERADGADERTEPGSEIPERFRPSRAVGVSTWLVRSATRFLEARSSRRGFLVGTAITGSAVAVGGVRLVTRPGTAYGLVTGGDCPPGSLCQDGFTEFCCSINAGSNSCPPGSFAGGWWRADFSSWCNGTRYYIDCMQYCCGPQFRQGGNTWCAGCVDCQCGPTCDHRKVYCNYFRYGQCHQEIDVTGPIACRVVTCVPPYLADPSCSPVLAVDNETAEHGAPCLPGGPPQLGGAAGELIAVTPARILDTRDGTGRGGIVGRVNAGQRIDVPVTGVGGIPAAGVDAVVLNVTVTEPTDVSWVGVWPAGAAQPLVSNLNFVPGQTVPNLVTVKVGASGRVSLANHAGATHAVFDVVGWYASAGGALGARFRGKPPTRLLDTRAGIGAPRAPVPAGGIVPLKVTGVGGVPGSGVAGVALNVTVTEPTEAGFVTVYPSDVSRPLASNLNFVPGLTVPNLVVMRVPANGVVNLFNSAGTTHLVADVVGWFDLNRGTSAGRYVPMAPVRLLDTRVSGQIASGGDSLQVNVLGEKGIPGYGVSAIVANVTVTAPTASSFVTVYPSDAPRPLASNLNFVAGQTVPNLVMVKLSAWGTISIFNLTGAAHVVVDVAGYFLDGSA